ncbi:hypothetical protein [Streptomyces sp. NPDC048349]|uniref:hypothetical protein n=1 Tax=Streptomyces sp. NPDC048349 TaxID=3155486 RepID=UPI00342622E9
MGGRQDKRPEPRTGREREREEQERLRNAGQDPVHPGDRSGKSPEELNRAGRDAGGEDVDMRDEEL